MIHQCVVKDRTGKITAIHTPEEIMDAQWKREFGEEFTARLNKGSIELKDRTVQCLGCDIKFTTKSHRAKYHKPSCGKAHREKVFELENNKKRKR